MGLVPAWKADQPNQINVYHITRTLPASPIKLQQIREETAKDNILAPLRDIIYEGWANSRTECPLTLCDFRNFSEDLTIEDGILLKCDRIAVPPTLIPDILKTIHEGPLGLKNAFSEPVALCIAQESQMILPNWSASVKLARNTRRERNKEPLL